MREATGGAFMTSYLSDLQVRICCILVAFVATERMHLCLRTLRPLWRNIQEAVYCISERLLTRDKLLREALMA